MLILIVFEIYCRVHVVFGRVVRGQDIVTQIENQRVDSNHRPHADVRIINCGELVLVKKGNYASIHLKNTLKS